MEGQAVHYETHDTCLMHGHRSHACDVSCDFRLGVRCNSLKSFARRNILKSEARHYFLWPYINLRSFDKKLQNWIKGPNSSQFWAPTIKFSHKYAGIFFILQSVLAEHHLRFLCLLLRIVSQNIWNIYPANQKLRYISFLEITFTPGEVFMWEFEINYGYVSNSSWPKSLAWKRLRHQILNRYFNKVPGVQMEWELVEWRRFTVPWKQKNNFEKILSRSKVMATRSEKNS